MVFYSDIKVVTVLNNIRNETLINLQGRLEPNMTGSDYLIYSCEKISVAVCSRDRGMFVNRDIIV